MFAQIGASSDEVKMQNERFINYTTMIGKEINDAVKKALAKYEIERLRMHPAESTFLTNNNTQTLADLIANKAEKEDITKLIMTKANRNEMNGMKQSITKL